MILNTPQAKITHLLRRTGFTATREQVDAFQGYSLADAVDKLLNASPTNPTAPPNLGKSDMYKLPLWWLNEMVHTTNPLLEKMTLFWHGHFTSALSKVPSPDLMGQQNMLLRQHALGNFRQFTYEISKDPAMLIWLDNDTNVKKAPNENYARELMELFTLGIGQYTEQDIHEVARALTGWRVQRLLETATFQPRLHDDGNKTIFGHTANYDLKSTVDLIVEHPACAPFIATKLWNFFGYPNPEPNVIQPLAQAFVKSNFEIKTLLRAMFTSEAFYSDKAYRSVVKSPAEYVVGLLSLFPHLTLKNERLPLAAMSEMGQVLFNPPNVAGWPGGPAWLSSASLFARYNFAEVVVTSLTANDFPLPQGRSVSAILHETLDRVGLADLSDNSRTQITNYMQKTPNREAMLRGMLHLLFISPEAQMK